MTDRFIPRAQSPIVHGASDPIDGTWYRFMRELGVDLDTAMADIDTAQAAIVTDVAALATHAALWPAHGWTRLANKALVVGKNTIAHGLSGAPTEVIPYHSEASGSAAAWLKAAKSGDLALPNADAWNDVTGWTETDPYAAFDATTGVWTCPRTGLYHLTADLNVPGVADANYAAGAFVDSNSVRHGTTYMVGGASSSRHLLSWMDTITAGVTVKTQVYRGAAALSVVASGGGFVTQLTIRSIDECNAYSWDATNIYVHSSYNHTRSFLVR